LTRTFKTDTPEFRPVPQSEECLLLREVIRALNLSDEVTVGTINLEGELSVEAIDSDSTPTHRTFREALVRVLTYVPRSDRKEGEPYWHDIKS